MHGAGELTNDTQDTRAACSLPAYKFWWGESQHGERVNHQMASDREWPLKEGKWEIDRAEVGEEGCPFRRSVGGGGVSIGDIYAETRRLLKTSAKGTAGTGVPRQQNLTGANKLVREDVGWERPTGWLRSLGDQLGFCLFPTWRDRYMCRRWLA